ncbi:MAG TPA: class I SAM-dependent methyltransferase [Terriglobia bacterium]|nr:class I SAM-dependent methyltransferase [Terriglobia bacterium]
MLHDTIEQVREEFNRWAEAGRGEGMERDHLPIVEPMLAMMGLQPSETLLDAGCGTGWLCRLLAQRAPQGQVVGIDVSDEMIRRARESSAGFHNVTFSTGGVDSIPAEADTFSRAVSVESAYYWPHPAHGLQEINRVLTPGGSAWVLINYYRDNLYCHQWGALYAIPAQLLSAEEWAALFTRAGFIDVRYCRIPDPTPTPDSYTGRWFRDAEQLRRFRAEGALLVYGTKAVF